MEMAYSWKAGTQFSVKAQVAADTIRDLQRSLGKDSITAQELLDASRDESAPLHSCFEWDDTVAAERYRREQARQIISSVEVRYIDNGVPKPPTRAFVSVQPVRPKQHGEYVAIDVAAQKPEYREQVLRNALIDLRNFQRKYATYEELMGVFKSIDDFADTLK